MDQLAAGAAEEAQIAAEGRDRLAGIASDPGQHRVTARRPARRSARRAASSSASSWAASPIGRPCAMPRRCCWGGSTSRYETRIVSAHRTPDRLAGLCRDGRARAGLARGDRRCRRGGASARHVRRLDAAAGAGRAGREPGALHGLDSLLSMVQMPAGVPVAHASPSAAPGRSMPALLAAAILALTDPALAAAAGGDFRAAQTAAVSRRSPPTCPREPRSGAAAAAECHHRHRRRRPARPHERRMAAARLGYRCHIVLTPEADSPAAQRVSAAVRPSATMRIAATLRRVRRARSTSSPSSSRTSVPPASICWPRCVRCGPSPDIAAHQPGPHRRRKASSTPHGDRHRALAAGADSRAALAAAVAALGLPAILKTTRLGYDGRGQLRRRTGPPSCDAAWAASCSRIR